MWKLFFIMLVSLFFSVKMSAQASGNIVYSDKKTVEQVPFADFVTDDAVIIDVSAIYNAIADKYVAVFNVSQLGETVAQTNSLMEARLNGVKQEFQNQGIKPGEIYIDMISFVPEYEYDVQKKLFSKSYNEVPKGFRLQKNIHVSYSKGSALDILITSCAKYEIYDLVKVEYYSENSKLYYDSLRLAAKKVLKERLKEYKEMGIATDNAFLQISENTFVKYPQELYANYQAYNSSPMDVVKKGSSVTQVSKTASFYYNPVSYKGYDVIFNPVITEPVIQYALTMKVKLSMKNPNDERNNEYYILTPNGELKLMKK